MIFSPAHNNERKGPHSGLRYRRRSNFVKPLSAITDHSILPGKIANDIAEWMAEEQRSADMV
jgi:hypothetical protein